MAKVSRDRGARWEREVATYLTKHTPHDWRRSSGMQGAGGVVPDIIGDERFWLECKAGTASPPSLVKAMEQAQRDATGGAVPVVASKWTESQGKPAHRCWYVVGEVEGLPKVGSLKKAHQTVEVASYKGGAVYPWAMHAEAFSAALRGRKGEACEVVEGEGGPHDVDVRARPVPKSSPSTVEWDHIARLRTAIEENDADIEALRATGKGATALAQLGRLRLSLIQAMGEAIEALEREPVSQDPGEGLTDDELRAQLVAAIAAPGFPEQFVEAIEQAIEQRRTGRPRLELVAGKQ